MSRRSVPCACGGPKSRHARHCQACRTKEGYLLPVHTRAQRAALGEQRRLRHLEADSACSLGPWRSDVPLEFVLADRGCGRRHQTALEGYQRPVAGFAPSAAVYGNAGVRLPAVVR